MYVMAHSVEVNPEGLAPVLNAEQVWAGLVMKAENALPFVPVMTRCDLIERKDNWLRRAIAIGDNEFEELVTLYAPLLVRFDRAGSDDFILNTISHSDRGLLLTFTFAIGFPGTEPGSAAEREQGDAMRTSYVGAVAATLARVREMARTGEL